LTKLTKRTEKVVLVRQTVPRYFVGRRKDGMPVFSDDKKLAARLPVSGSAGSGSPMTRQATPPVSWG